MKDFLANSIRKTFSSKIINIYTSDTVKLQFVQHKFQMDNDPKHTSHYVRNFLENKGIYWWKMPAESPDLNPIEKVWGSMKNVLCDVHFCKPENHNLAGVKKWHQTVLEVIVKI